MDGAKRELSKPSTSLFLVAFISKLFMHSLFFWDKVSLCITDWPRTHSQSSCLSFPNLRITRLHHMPSLSPNFRGHITDNLLTLNLLYRTPLIYGHLGITVKILRNLKTAFVYIKPDETTSPLLESMQVSNRWLFDIRGSKTLSSQHGNTIMSPFFYCSLYEGLWSLTSCS